MSHVQGREVWLWLATFLVAVAGLVYELIAATASSFLLGDSIRQFSFVIGIFLFAMGAGAWLSRFAGDSVRGFVTTQIALGVIGGFLAPAIFAAYAWGEGIAVPLYGGLVAIGVLSGMEIPLIARVLKEIGAPEFRFENVLTADYIGALVASLAFPLLIIPYLGLMTASLAFGALNLGVAGISLWLFRAQVGRALWVGWAVVLAVTLTGLVLAERAVSVTHAALFQDDVILSRATPYQQITVTRFRDRTRLFLDYAIQFDTRDEHRYHEALVHPAMAQVARRQDILILGGGDGMAAREVLRWNPQAVTLVDLDPAMTDLFRTHPDLSALNDGALADPRVTVVNRDAWTFVEADPATYDVIILDLPDPKNLSLSRLYSAEFYALLVERLNAGGAIVTQAGSPLYARQAFWSVVATLEAARNPLVPEEGLSVTPYHTYVPSFGLWGFAMASHAAFADRPLSLPDGTRYLTPATWPQLRVFDPDTARIPAEVNTIQSHPLPRYYADGWETWFD
ncbi:polyamine aminopropyltransferase [Pseudaestuariivita atlantica]|uniref:Polyamine aminopropyltransferase n=1 Tax=Pseudaestuariivita atlantica TaxID=1317121 RepID=A0A0L1JNM6_9RHOB|nr:polyamine aminopropyltransferase [Pseudaestuariivita atlantica]KNG93322.1 spermidine synthase [Pseudaestuariivita atlantica]